MKKRLSFLLVVSVILFSFAGLTSCKKNTESGCRYEITAEYREEARTLAGTVKTEYFNSTGRELSSLEFQLYPNAYRKNALYDPIDEGRETSAYYAGESYGDITITSVVGAKNWSIDGEDENILLVDLPRPLAPSEKITLDISFVTLLAKVNHVTGVTARVVNLTGAFPTLCTYVEDGFVENVRSHFGEAFSNDYADYKISLTIPSEYVVAATADGEISKGLESKTKYVFEGKSLRDFALVLSEYFEVAETNVGNVTVRYYYYDDKNADARLALAKEALEYFQDSFGSYLYPTYSFAQTGLCIDGAAYPALSLISDSLGEEALKRSIVRETAKQWWYAAVGCDRAREPWIEESLAEYSSLLFFGEKSDHGLTREELVKKALTEYRSYFSVYGSIFGGVDTSMRRSLGDFSGEYEYRCLTKDKGVVMWYTLQESIGEKKIFQGLKNFYKNNRCEIVGEKELLAAFGKTGVNVDGFFEAFLSGKAVV